MGLLTTYSLALTTKQSLLPHPSGKVIQGKQVCTMNRCYATYNKLSKDINVQVFANQLTSIHSQTSKSALPPNPAKAI